ncbi:MAG: bifunctional tetrahydrofolate synthase/dihydrofolate synthase [Woeseiaceae bacterium]|nr:bifunctional tetrahydrofolate synthase/dihydrofolate synthase [Woeseiaceae bacterium]
MPPPGTGATLAEWLRWQEGLSAREIELGLDRTIEVLGRLKLPRPGRVLTVAGTNGKGSSVAMLEALYRRRPGVVGAYSSPHVLRYAERVRLDGEAVRDGTLVRAFETVERARRGVPLTYFEFGTLAALCVFAEARAATIILEVGLGGRLDAVNALDHDGCLITNVSLDHQEWLGDDIADIAREKAGVMRRSKPAVFGSIDMPPVIGSTADALGARLIARGRDFDWRTSGTGWCWQGTTRVIDALDAPALRGRHQFDNAAAALALVEAVGDVSLLDRQAINAALGSVRLTGRLQLVHARQRRWLLDGAHNAAGAATLADALADLGGAAAAVLGILRDKDAAGIVAALAPQVQRFIATRAASERALTPQELDAIVDATTNRTRGRAEPVSAALEAALEQTGPGDLIVVAGSFYTLGPAFDWLGFDGDTPAA